jgi:ABC-type uncharacterized transport system involved in gliding motility auxiliary subunit
MTRKFLTGTGIVIAAALFVAINVLAGAGLRQARLDLTEDRLYTLSQGTRNVLAALNEPIALRFFFSDKLANELPQVKLYANRVRELLERYAALSGGRIRLEVIDPEPFSDAEDRAVQAGVQAVPVDSSGRAFYFGLVGTNSVDDQQVIPFFQAEKEQFLEYDLTRLVYALSLPKKPVVGVLGALPLEFGPGGMMAAMRGQSQPYAIMAQLRQFFELRTLDADIRAIERKIDVLLLVHAKGLGDQALYAIDQFVLRGGKVIVLADPYSETAATIPDMSGMPPMLAEHSSALPRLFAAWGLSLRTDVFVADLGLAQRVQTGEAGPRQVVDYVAWLAVGPGNFNADDVVTADLRTLNFASAGALRPVEGATTSFTPLVWSSDKAMLVAVEKVRGRPDPQGLLEAFKPTGEKYALAARLSGPVKSAFPDGPPPAPEKKDGEAEKAAEPKEAPAPHLEESAGPANIIVIADADMIDDRFWVRTQDVFGQRVAIPIASNADFLINAVDNLAGSSDLISLRSRGRSQRPFERIEALRRDAEQQLLVRERSLQKKLDETQKKIADLQSKSQGASAALLSAEERAAMEGFREELIATRRELRGVQRELNKDIERLELGVKFVNIGLVPIGIGLVAAGVAAVRRRRRQAAAAR